MIHTIISSNPLKRKKLFIIAFAMLMALAGVFTIPRTRTCHGNCDENNDPHEVYEIYMINLMGIRITLKFGITSQLDFTTKDGNPRPEYQCQIFRTFPEYKGCVINYVILYRMVPNRIAAKQIEQTLVDQYFATYSKMPERQFRPLPSDFKIK